MRVSCTLSVVALAMSALQRRPLAFRSIRPGRKHCRTTGLSRQHFRYKLKQQSQGSACRSDQNFSLCSPVHLLNSAHKEYPCESTAYQRDRKAKCHQHHERLHHPFRRMKRRQHGRTNLDNKPADDCISDRNLVASLQLGEEIVNLHEALTLNLADPLKISSHGASRFASI
jgi:hypothetical protein